MSTKHSFNTKFTSVYPIASGWMKARAWICALLTIALAAGHSKAQDESRVEVVAEPDQPKSVVPLPKSDHDIGVTGEVMAIDWVGVLELARASSLEIEIAAEKVHEANIQHDIARMHWLPSLKVGTSWLHHDGRTQDIPGQILDASKSSVFSGSFVSLTVDPQKAALDILKSRQQVFSRSGQLDRATREALQKASLAYIDVVAAQAGASISMEIAKLIDKLVDRSRQLRQQGLATEVDVLQNVTKSQAQQQILKLAQQNQLAAGARLAQILNLETGTSLVAADDWLIPVTLIDESRPAKELIEQAHEQGPGLAEVVALISAFEQQQKQLRVVSLLPSVSVDVGYGAFGGGTGSTYSNFNPRTDLGINVYWDLLKIVPTRQNRELFESKRRQASMDHEMLIRKLETGVLVARHGAVAARERVKLAETEIDTAIRAYELSETRLQAGQTINLEVLSAIGALGTAYQNYLNSVIDFNRFQIQLQYLIGVESCNDTEQTEPIGEPATDDRADSVAVPVANVFNAKKRKRHGKVRRPVPLTSPDVEWKTRRRHPKFAFSRALRVGRSRAIRSDEGGEPRSRGSFFSRVYDQIRGLSRNPNPNERMQ